MESENEQFEELFVAVEPFEVYPQFNDLEGLNAFLCGLEASFLDYE